MRFRVEWARLRNVAKRADRFRMPSLPRESDAEVERRVRIPGSNFEHRTKRALGPSELLFL